MRAKLVSGLIFCLGLGIYVCSCQSEGGYRPEPVADMQAPQPDLSQPPDPLCGNGVVDKDRGELCDTKIAAGQPGACPSLCVTQADPCKQVSLTGSGCTAACEIKTITSPVGGDRCCPPGQTEATDRDCRPLSLDGSERQICENGPHHVPVLGVGRDHFAVGCVPSGSQQTAANVKIFDAAGTVLRSHNLRTMDGYYYNEVQTSFFDGRFQALYQYNCEDDGSWSVGWGWGCIDFREYAFDGTEVTSSLVFGMTGHNGHPVLDWNGAGFGVGWVSYDSLYSRLIGADRKLTGARTANTFIQQDPKKSDDRNGARTRLHFTGTGYGMFTIVGYQLYFTRLNSSGAQLQAMQGLGPAYSQTSGGNLSSIYDGASYHVSYYDHVANKLVVIRVDDTGKKLGTTNIQDGEFRYPSLVRVGDRIYLFTHDASKQGQVTVLDLMGNIVQTSQLGSKMTYPQAAYDQTTDNFGVVFLDDSGTVKYQHLRRGP